MGARAYTADFAGGEALRAVVAQTLAETGQPAHGPEPQHLLPFLLRRSGSRLRTTTKRLVCSHPCNCKQNRPTEKPPSSALQWATPCPSR